jgi:HD-GYP domain-containing protein (c-di-GMP phosphodiesterase class II)
LASGSLTSGAIADIAGIVNDIEQLETALEIPPSAHAEALAASIAARLLAVPTDAPLADRARTVRGLIALSHHYYRIGNLATAGSVLAATDALSHDLDAADRVAALLRRGEFELLTWDVGAALDHTSTALQIAHAAGLRLEEVHVWINYGMALQATGLWRQADVRLAYALELLDGKEEPRLRCNIWALRSHVGFHTDENDLRASMYACEQALRYAEASPPRSRDSMACTAFCNLAALSILRDDVNGARQYLDKAAARSNLGSRPRWLIATLTAMLDVRIRNEAAERDALDTLLAPGQAPARAYVIETYAVMAAMYTSMGDATHAHEALVKLSIERASALWATLTDPDALDVHPGKTAVPPIASANRRDFSSLGVLERLAITAELRDDATGRHCYRVGRLSMLLARRAGLSEAESGNLDLAARLHDIGKFAIPDAILLKPGKLDEAETQLMRTHTTIGADLLATRAPELHRAAEQIARFHHEHWNGAGYPSGLAGDSIPLAARIAALADVYDALSHERPYKRAWSHEDSVSYVREMRGTQFDPRLTDLFLALMDESAADLPRFLTEQEKAASDSPYVLAQSRVSKALH